MAQWSAWVGIAIAVISGLVALYAKAAMADIQSRLAVLEERAREINPNLDLEVAVLKTSLDTVDRLMRENYTYSHSLGHELRNYITVMQGQIRVIEFQLGVKRDH